MLDQFRKKRLNITHSFDTNKARISSSEKRKQIQANLQKFKKELEQGSRVKSPSRSLNNFYKTSNSNQMMQSPTMKDLINPFVQSNKNYKKNSQQIESPRFKQPQSSSSSKQIQQQKQNNLSPYPIQNEEQKMDLEQKLATAENKLSNQSQKKLQNKQQEKLQRQISFGEQELQRQINNVQSPRKQDSLGKNMEPTYQNKQQNESGLNFNYNDSNYGSSNGSSAIFFTSQFRDYLSRDKNNPQPQGEPEISVNSGPPTPPPPPLNPITHEGSWMKKSQPSQHSHVHNQTDKQLGQSFLKIGDEELSQSNEQSRTKKILLHNQSGRSLAFSNNDESILRDSKINNEYEKQKYSEFVQGLVRQKLDEELVIQIGNFGKNILCTIVDKVLKKNIQDEVKDIGKLMKTLKKATEFMKKVQMRLKRSCFDGFLMLKQYKFEETKNQIKAENFRKQIQQRQIKRVFQAWKNIDLENQKLILEKNNKRDEKMKKNILQVFKMIWYDSKVKRQVDLFYLSKIFSALKSVVASEQKKSQNLAIKHYCKSLKKRYFKLLEQGIQQHRHEREKQQLAVSHYEATIMKKYFEAWVDECSKSPQYVSLTLTSKNMFKQTQNSGWLGIRTVDFSQLSQHKGK